MKICHQWLFLAAAVVSYGSALLCAEIVTNRIVLDDTLSFTLGDDQIIVHRLSDNGVQVISRSGFDLGGRAYLFNKQFPIGFTTDQKKTSFYFDVENRHDNNDSLKQSIQAIMTFSSFATNPWTVLFRGSFDVEGHESSFNGGHGYKSVKRPILTLHDDFSFKSDNTTIVLVKGTGLTDFVIKSSENSLERPSKDQPSAHEARQESSHQRSAPPASYRPSLRMESLIGASMVLGSRFSEAPMATKPENTGMGRAQNFLIEKYFGRDGTITEEIRPMLIKKDGCDVYVATAIIGHDKTGKRIKIDHVWEVIPR